MRVYGKLLDQTAQYSTRKWNRYNPCTSCKDEDYSTSETKTTRFRSACRSTQIRDGMRIFCPRQTVRELRNLVRARLGLVRTRTDYKNKVHSILAKYEYKPSTHKTFSKKGIKWLQQIKLTETDRMAINAYLDGIQMTQRQIDSFESHMASISRQTNKITHDRSWNKLHNSADSNFRNC